MSKKKAPDSPNLRNQRVVIYLTEEDAAYLNRYSKALGFNARSGFIVALLERLMIGGFSIRVSLQLGIQLSKIERKKGALQESLYFGTRPLPKLPIEGVELKEETKALLQIRNEIKHDKQAC